VTPATKPHSSSCGAFALLNIARERKQPFDLLLTDHAAYVASWIKVLKDNNRAIFTAASYAQRAADFLHGFAGHHPRSSQCSLIKCDQAFNAN